MSKVLFLWDADPEKAGRRMFYKKLSGYSQGDKYSYPGVLDEIPEKDWEWINRSNLLVETGHAKKIRKLLQEHDDIMDWHEFKVKKKL